MRTSTSRYSRPASDSQAYRWGPVVFLAFWLLRVDVLGDPGRLDPFFDTGFGVDHPVRILGVLESGHMVLLVAPADPVGGARAGLVRLRSDGRLDQVLDVEVEVRATLDDFALLPDGRILAAAAAIASGDINRTGLIRLLPSGEVDLGFRSPALVSRRIRRDADGRILVELSDGRGIVRLNEDGSLDDQFRTTPVSLGWTLLGLQTDGRILVAKSVTHGDGGNGIEVVRLTHSGELDPTFASPPRFGLSILLTGLQPDGRIVVGETRRGLPNGVFRLNADGAPDLSFDAEGAVSRDSVDDSWLKAIAVGPEGAVYIGGVIETKHEDYRSGDDAYELGIVRRLDARQGGEDRTFDVRLSGDWPGRPSSVEQIVILPDGRVLIAGTFTVVNGVARRHLARLEPDGSLDGSFNANQGADAAVRALLALADGSLVGGGGPRDDEAGVRGGLGRRPLDFVRPDGALDPAREVAFPIRDPDGATVKALVRHGEGAFLVGAIDSGILRFRDDGSRDATFVPEFVPQDACLLLVQPDNRILVAASGFLHAQGGAGIPTGVIRLRGDGSHDPSYGAGTVVSGTITAMDLSSEGRLIIGGGFDRVSGVPRNRLARLDANGLLDPTWSAGFGPDGDVRCLAHHPEGGILVGGEFQNFAGMSHRGLVRLHEGGALDASFDVTLLLSAEPARTRISAMLIQPDGRILIGGTFDRVGGLVRRNIARLLPDGRVDSGFESARGVDGEVLALALREDGRVVVGGDFLSVEGVPRRRVAQLLGRRENEVRLGPWRWVGGWPAFELASVAPRTVTVEMSVDLVHWNEFQTRMLDGHPVLITNANANSMLAPRQFFRARWEP